MAPSKKEGFMTNLFLSEQELDNLAHWKYKVVDSSVTTKILTPFWNWLVTFVPANVAPNVLTLAAFGCVLQAFWVVVVHGDEFPKASAISAAILTYVYFTLDALDGKHARNTKNGSPLGELFDHGCDNVGAAFQVITLLKIMGWEDPATQWYLVQAAQLIFLSQHISPYNAKDKTIRFGLLNGPGEVLHFTIIVMCAHAAVGQAFLWYLFVTILRTLETRVADLGLPPLPDDVLRDGQVNAEAFLAKGSQLLYYCVVVGLVTQLGLMLFAESKKHRLSGRALLICLAIRCVPSVFLASGHTVTLEQTVSDGVFLSILTSDIIVAKIADREVHSLVVVMSMASIMSNFAIYASILVYYVTVFGDICVYMNLPLLGMVTNVYCDGIFDLLHRGHMEQFRQALAVSGGTRLFVGVVNDKDATEYKRKPIMSEEERMAAVASCKYVHAVIPNAPVTHMCSKPGEEPTRTERMVDQYKPVRLSQKHFFLDRARCIMLAQLRPGSSFLRSALHFFF